MVNSAVRREIRREYCGVDATSRLLENWFRGAVVEKSGQCGFKPQVGIVGDQCQGAFVQEEGAIK